MKKESVGNITRSGGFSRLVSDVETNREPIQIVRHNQTVAILVPANDDLARLLGDIVDNGKLIQNLASKADDSKESFASLMQVLVGYALLGDVSKRILSQTGYSQSFQTVTDAINENFGRG